MRIRPCRRFITQEPTLCGVRVSDGMYVGTAVLIGFVVPLIFGINFYGVPGSLVFAIIALFASVSFFNWVRKAHRPKWLDHVIAYQLREFFRNGNDMKRAHVGRIRSNWLVDYNELDATKKNWLTKTSSRQISQ